MGVNLKKVKQWFGKNLLSISLALALLVATNSLVQQGSVNSELRQSISNLQQENVGLIEAVNVTSFALIASREKEPLLISCANNQKDYLKALRRAEIKYRMPKGLLTQVAYHESNFDPKALSHKGAVGIMQIVPKWHPEVNARDPYASIDYAGKHLTELKNRFDDWEMALAAWNWGPKNLMDNSFNTAPTETRNFVRKVMEKVQV